MARQSRPSRPSSLCYPDGQDLADWVEVLSRIKGFSEYLPVFTSDWHVYILSAYELTEMHPKCSGDALQAAARIFHRITKNHSFPDGNKRSAVLSTALFLKLNGYHFRMSVEDLVSLSKGVAESHDDPEVIIDYLVKEFEGKTDQIKGILR